MFAFFDESVFLCCLLVAPLKKRKKQPEKNLNLQMATLKFVKQPPLLLKAYCKPESLIPHVPSLIPASPQAARGV